MLPAQFNLLSSDERPSLKAEPIDVFGGLVREVVESQWIDTGGYPFALLFVYIAGGGDNPLVQVEGLCAPTPGLSPLRLPDWRASPLVGSNHVANIELPCRWLKFGIASLEGTFAANQGVRVFLQPYTDVR